MADTATKVTPAKGKRAAKPKSARKSKTPSTHPKYMDMVVEAVKGLKERQGSSRQAILKYIGTHYSVGKDNKVVNTHLKMALKRGESTGVLKRAKGQGASGSFRLNDNKTPASPAKKASPKKPKGRKTVAKKAKPTTPKKPKAKKAATPVTPAEKSTTPVPAVEATPKKAAPAPATPKKAATPRTPKPKKSPKKAGTPKKVKTPKPKKAAKSPRKARK